MYLSISKIGNGDSIQTALNLVPIPPAKEAGSAYGEKAVITITDPVCVDYQWVGDWTPTFSPPLHEHAARNTTISPANPSQQEVSTENVKLKFDGWYRLWNNSVDKEEDGKKTWNYNGKKYVSYQNKDAGKLIDFDTEKFYGAKTVYAHWAKMLPSRLKL